MYRVVLAVGLTGGHIYPAKALAEELGTEKYQFLFVARKNSPLAQTLLVREGLSVITLAARGMPRSLTHWITDGLPFVWQQIAAFLTARRALKDWRPHLVVGFGGYVAFPVTVAARILGIKTLVYEPNAKMGVASRAAGFWADRIATVLFNEGGRHSIQLEPLIRRRVLAYKNHSVESARAMLGFASQLPCVLIFGGSQGANAINHAAVYAISKLREEGIRFSFIHVTGGEGYKDAKELYRLKGLGSKPPDTVPVSPDKTALFGGGYCLEYLEEIGCAYRAASVVVSRSGALTVQELSGFGVPSILVPLGHSAEGHQRENARYLERLGIARIVTEGPDLIPDLTVALKEALSGHRAQGDLPKPRNKQSQGLPDLVRTMLEGNNG